MKQQIVKNEDEPELDNIADAQKKMEKNEKQKNVDSGFAWIVVFGSFIQHVTVVGCMYSSGILFSALLEEFKLGRGPTSLPSALHYGLLLGCGIPVGVMIDNFGLKMTNFFGGCVLLIGYIGAALSPELWLVTLTYGVLGGYGACHCYLPAVQIIPQYFKAKRALAMGIAVAGAGVGTFSMPIIFSAMFQKLGWRWGLVIAGLICFVSSSFFSFVCLYDGPLKPKIPEEEMKKRRQRTVCKAFCDIFDKRLMAMHEFKIFLVAW